MSQKYYQLGGFRSHIHLPPNYEKNYDRVSESLAGPLRSKAGGAIELVLGIVESGASYILLTPEQMSRIRQIRSIRTSHHDPYPSTNFLSLSPIFFTDHRDLSAKLAKYQVSHGKKGAPTYDNSQANKSYCSGAGHGTPRILFEEQRVIHHMLSGSIDEHKFSLLPTAWKNTYQIGSIFFNSWTADHRPRLEKISSPKVLDIGWATASLNDPRTPTYMAHMEVSEHKLFRNQGLQRKQLSDELTDTLDFPALSSRLQELFRDLDRTILLVYNETATLSMLRFFGVDVSGWHSGTRKLLWSDEHIESDSRTRPINARDPRSRQGGRRRSMSPRHDVARQRPRSPPPPPPPPQSSVHIVDVELMYSTVRHMSPRASIMEDAADLDLQSDTTSICAAEQAELMLKMWASMAGGDSIDDQYAARWGNGAIRGVHQPHSSGSGGGPTHTSAPVAPRSDEDIDPNDIVPVAHDKGGHSTGISVYDELLNDEDYEEF